MAVLKEHVKFLSEPSSEPVNSLRKLVQPFRGYSGKSVETLLEMGAPQLTTRPTLINTTSHIEESYVCT